MTLPLEILDTILEHIPIDEKGKQALVVCALVATWWTGPSQRRLFSSVVIHDGNYQRWMDGVASSGSKSHLLKYVRSMWYRCPTLVAETSYWMQNLHNVHSFDLFGIKIGNISEREYQTCFSAFRETLTNLTLDDFDTSFSAFVTLVDYFPNITTLQLHSFEVKPDEGPVPPLSRPFRGRLCIHCFEDDYVEFFDRLAKLDPQYEELVIGSEFSSDIGTELAESLYQIGANTVKYLRLTADLEREHLYETPPS